MRLLFEGGYYYRQLMISVATIRGWLLFKVRHLFEEIQYIYTSHALYMCCAYKHNTNLNFYRISQSEKQALFSPWNSFVLKGSEHTGWSRSCRYTYICIVHPESFRSNAQNAIAFARRNRPRVKRNDAFACVYLRSRAFASTVRDRPRARTYIHS